MLGASGSGGGRSGRGGYSGGRGGGGKNFGGGPPALDRFCSCCGNLIKGQIWEKTAICPHRGCQAALPLRQLNGFGEDGWGRCVSCDAFLHRDHCYCQICKRGNDVGIEKARRLKEVERQREALVTKEKIRKIVEENERLRKENEEKNLIIEKQEEEILKRALEGAEESEASKTKKSKGGDESEDNDDEASISKSSEEKDND